MTGIRWTRTEVMACAYCWCEWTLPEERSDTPEQYWLRVNERTRMECRKVAMDRLLVDVALRRAAALLPPDRLTDEQLDAVGTAMGLRLRHRVWRNLSALYHTLRPRDWSDADRAEVQAELVKIGDPDALEEERLKAGLRV